MECAICHADNGQLHQVREMMFGTRETFPYWECAGCGCISLAEVPADLGKYYPKGYYSMNGSHTSAVKRLRDRVYLSSLSFLVNWHSRMDFDAVRGAALKHSKRVLDVGCGSGYSIADLREIGYSAEGVDPFVDADIRDRFGVRVQRKTLAEISGTWDIILFLDSFEHIPDQVGTLSLARERLAEHGACVVHIPVVGWAWKNYGVNWAQLDAPRHIFLHTSNSFGIVAREAGFKIDDIVFDSDEFQFWLSEAYRNDQAKNQAKRPGILRAASMRFRAHLLNRNMRGDQAKFYLSAR
jgi:SAM-dependent methyltransferase